MNCFSSVMPLIYVVFTMILSSFCAIEEGEKSLMILYAGKTVTYLAFFLILGCSQLYLGTTLGVIVFIASIFPIGHRTVGWVIALPGICRILRLSHDPGLAEEAIRIYRRHCKICGFVLTILYAAFLVLSFVFKQDDSLLNAIRFWHVLIFLAVLALLYILRKPVMFYLYHKYRQV